MAALGCIKTLQDFQQYLIFLLVSHHKAGLAAPALYEPHIIKSKLQTAAT